MTIIQSALSFSLSGLEILGSHEGRQRLAILMFPVMLERCEVVIRRFISDKPMFGKCPLPR